MVNIALRLGLVLEQNLEDPDTRAVLGQGKSTRLVTMVPAGRGGSICRWTASKGERTGLLRVRKCAFSLTHARSENSISRARDRL